MSSLDPRSRDVLRAGQAAEGPTASDKERLRQKLAVALAAGVTGPAIAAPAVVAAKWWASRAVIGSVGVVSAVVVGVTAVVATRSPDPVPPPAPIIATPPPAPVVTAEPIDEVEPPELPEPSSDQPTPPPKKPVKRVKRSSGKPDPVEAPAPPVVVTTPAPPEKPTADELEAETQGLKEVQLALRAKEPQRALALLDQQDRRFAQGQLRQEREGARVLALCATDPAAGVAAFERFRAAHPSSPMLSRLKGACGQ